MFLVERASAGGKDTTIHAFARAIRAMLRFWNLEGTIVAPVIVDMPKLLDKRQSVLTADDVRVVLAACTSKRDKALVAFAVDTGLRREELASLDWTNIDFKTGVVLVIHGKGGKTRTAVVGATARRALLAYRREGSGEGPVFRGRDGEALGGQGVGLVFKRLSKRTGIPFSTHSCRRTMATLSLASGMDLIALQRILGHADIAMTAKYVAYVADDLLIQHAAHSPMDGLRR
jgi:integrase